MAEKSHEEDTPTDGPPGGRRDTGWGRGDKATLATCDGRSQRNEQELKGTIAAEIWSSLEPPHGCSCVLVLSLPGGHLESVGGGLAGELGVAGAPGGCDAWMFFSSEKSCLITSKKLLKGLPTQTGRKETERANR